MGLMIWLFRIGAGIAGVIGIGLTAIYIYQEKLLYVPVVPGMPKDAWIPAERYGLASQDAEVESADGVKLHAWLLTDPTWSPEFIRSRPVILFFQENAGNMSFRLPFFKGLIQALDCPIFAVSYRGYGKSQGRPNEKGLKLDAEAGLRHLLKRQDVDGSRVVVFGKSLGGAVAIFLAAAYQEKLKGLIIENTFTSVEDMVGSVLPPLGPLIGAGKPLNRLVTNKWYSLKTIPKIDKLPILMLSSGEDEMVPPSQMKELRAAQKSPTCKFVEFPTAGHMNAYDADPTRYWMAVAEFVTLYTL
ncbi:hypothetical protein CEUSTIGMA_g2838.t1 [Chlamydomonas eustigma]|uniref:Peptidase S9 prolyl oligopeptidase catalytic domain-containing protein n=1 Tax=Chlamydomonas eustigma TaxID=1157962 RepID=A0A250WX40_9CHLO|nr:hypothetical protein CEUSTIGMA_g2838.t1 [Chlamydomonas eustigma]|eukprot:GAX75394.1 hypothetical protein CEUSTIGMA_g2838.t1 [Chlamydomonas eustigma]